MTHDVTEVKKEEKPLIEVSNLCRWYGSVQAVRDLSFSVERGEIVGFLGPNGAGKSTTLRMLVGYLGPSSGQVRVAGHDVVQQPLLASKQVGYMPESAALYPEMRVGEYLKFRAALKQLPANQRLEQVEAALAKTEIAEVQMRRIGALSRGFRQRVALADALLGNPPILILDEPTAGLDPNQIHSVRQLIRQLGDKHTVLLSTHILSEVESICSRVLVISRGRLVAQGPIAELTRRAGGPQAQFVLTDPDNRAQALLQSMSNVADVEVLRGADESQPQEQLEAGQGAVHLHVRLEGGPAESAANLEQLVAMLVQQNVGVREVRIMENSLEDVFRQLTRPTVAPDPHPPLSGAI